MNTHKHAGPSFALNLTTVAVAACFATGGALANPTGPAPVSGIAAVNGVGSSVVTVDTSATRSIINWQSFSINAGELTRFNQPSNIAAVLNRVIGSGATIDPSVILGQLQSNGRVFLINPSGIVFGASAQVDVAGLVASSLNLSDGDFLADKLKFTAVPGAGSVVNQGTIGTTPGAPGAHVYLVGPAVTNGGFIASPQGEVILAAGNSVELVDPGTPNLRVEIVAPANQAANLGMILADSGRIGIHAGLINQSGTLQANGAVAMPDGRIVLKATSSTTLAAGSQTMAKFSPGASVEIETGDLTVNGNVTSGAQSIVATGNMTVAATTGNAQVVANGQQTVNVGGALTVQGAGTGSNRFARLNSSGDQNITAGNITIQGGAGGTNNFAEIRHTGGGDQTVTVTGGGTLAIHGGATGTDNRARLRNEVGDQAIDVTGGAIVISGGGSSPADSGNSARIEGAGTGMQTVDAHTITILGGADGTDNFSGIQAAHQAITTTGDVTLIGGGGSVTGARIGSFGTGAPTDLHLQVGGNLTLIGGSTTDANIGSNRFGNAQTDIVAEVSGNITLTPGATPGADARIGSPDGLVAGGNIALTAGGDITLSSTPGIGSAIRTLGNASLQGNTITQGPDAVIQADQLSVTSTVGTTLVGANQVSGFDATGGFISGVALNNASPLLTVNGIETLGGPLAIDQAGDLAIHSNVFSGAQSIHATGDITVTPGPLGNVAVSATGPQSISTDGTLNVVGAPDGGNRFAQLVSRGEQTITAADINIVGGTGNNNFAQIIHPTNSTGNQTITVTSGGSLSIQGGATGDDNFARIRNDVGNQAVNVAGGAIVIRGGGANPTDDGSFARIENRSSGLQTINAQSIAITGGAGLNTSPGIQAAHQNITTTGDVTIIGGTGSVTGSRIGAYGTGNPTDLALNVGGNLTMSGGPETDATLGSNRFGNARTDMTVNVAGNITLNPGGSPGADVRIGSPEGLVGDGNISLSAGGNIALNSMPGAGAEIRTLGNVSLYGQAITQGPDAVIQADQLFVGSNTGTNLGGANQISGFSAYSLNGSVTLNNTSPLLTVNGINALNGLLDLRQEGDLRVQGNVNTAAQTIAATGDMTVEATTGSVRINSLTDQTVNVGGTLTLQGGSSGSGRSARITSNGVQNVTAGNIVINGGTGGSNNFTEIRQFNNADQNVSITGGGTLAITGGPDTGTDNFARIRNDGGNQRISVPGGQIVIAGGAGPDGPPDLADTANNFARIEGRNGTFQTVDAHAIEVYGGTSGSYNFSGIQSEYQNITTTGDVTVVGGGGYVTGARIGGIADGPTNLQMNVGGNLTLTGGTETDASLGSNREGGYRTDISVFANGNITLNPGTSPGADARIGSPEVNVADGNISLAANGEITMNSAPGAGSSVIRTLGNISLQGNAITQGADAVVQADGLTTVSQAGTALAGNNQVAAFNATNGTTGGVLLNNTSPVLTVTGISTLPGSVTLTQDGNLAVTGNVLSGPQSISATGDMTVGSGTGSVMLYAGSGTGAPAGEPNASPRALGVGLLDRLAGNAPIDIRARSLVVQGGSETAGFAAITGGPISIETTGGLGSGDLSLTGGSGLGAFSWLLSSGNVNLNVGGNLRLDAGTGPFSFARIQTVRPNDTINICFPNLATGGYFVNGELGYRDGLNGFFAGPVAAKPGKQLDITYGQ